MADNYGKKFEALFKKQWSACFPEGLIIRIYDTVNGFVGIHNICDFIGYVYPNIFLIECKTHKGASIPFDAISQIDNMAPFVGIKGVRVGVVVYLYEKDCVLYVPISTLIEMRRDGKKSVGLKAVEDYNIIVIPSVKKRIFLESDYTVLRKLKEGE